MQRYTVSRDDRYHEAWPSICTAANGDLVCCYSEADVHGGGAIPSAVVRISEDEGASWSEPIVVETLLDRPESGYLMCRSVIRLNDGSLLLGVDWNRTESISGPSERLYVHRGLSINWSMDPASGPFVDVWLYRSFDNGRTWHGPEKTGCFAVGLILKQISDGTIFISASHYRCEGEYESQMLYRSTDNGRTWSDAITVLKDPRYLACEGDIVEMEDGMLVMYIRSDTNPAGTGIKCLSYDGGLSWEGPFAAGYWPVCGRVNAGRLTSGEVLVVHRVGGFTPQNWFGFFIEEAETAVSKIPNDGSIRLSPSEGSRWGMIDNDTSRYPDYGYGDWVELLNGDIYVVNYIVDDAPKNRPQIRGYRFSRDELFSPDRDLAIDFAAPAYKRGKLAGQQGWVRQKPELWKTNEWQEKITYGPLGNYVIVDASGKHVYTGTASMTGSRNKGGKEEVVRRDIGPFDLNRENVKISLIHKGRQRCATFRVLDQSAETVVELRSDSVYEELWAQDNRGYRYLSEIQCGDEWWETVLYIAKKEVKLSTRRAGSDDSWRPWCTIHPNEKYAKASAITAVAAAIGDSGGFYIDSIRIVAEPAGS